MSRRFEKYIPLVVLPLALVVCLVLWFSMNSVVFVKMQSDTGVWDLRGIDFDHEAVSAVGSVEYIPDALLTPEEFEARSDEIQIGDPRDTAEYATSRIRLIVPDGVTYTISRRSSDYAYRVYVNGKWMADAGMPGDSKESTIPDVSELVLTDEPVDGEIVIVQQVSNFVHREGGWHDGVHIGLPSVMRATYRHDVTAIILGCFLALFLVHLSLFFILRTYRANLYFALFCLVWFLRSGVTEAKVFSTLFPFLPWIVKFKIEYLALPITGILLILTINELFPGVLPRYFRRIVYAFSILFVGVFLFADSYFMSWAILGCYAYEVLAILFVILYFIRRFRHPTMAQKVSLAGAGLFLYSALRDMFYYSGKISPPFMEGDLSQISMLVFVFFQMTAMFIGTVHVAEKAILERQKLTLENASLDRINRMRNDLIATVSHETRTPLAVLSGYAELIAMELRERGVDEQTATDLDKIADETQRIAKIMEEMQRFSRVKSIDGQRVETQVADIVRQTAQLYAPILARKKTEIIVDAADDLPLVLANAGELTQIMFNLLQNAGDHTENGVILVSALSDNDQVTVTMMDTGMGISAEMLPHVFERNISDSAENSGLGLSICKEIIESHGGTISVKSEQGKGTIVAFTLPLVVSKRMAE